MAGDKLSSLSDDLIHHILSFIPSTKLHAQTSVLSKRWRLIWAHHHNLHLSMPHPDLDAAAEEIDSIAKIYVLSVNRCLRSFNSPSLNSVTIDLWLPTSLSAAESRAHLKTADRWIRFAGLRSARKLTVQARSEPYDWYSRIPSSVFSLHRSLTDLTVRFSAVPDVPGNFPGFRNLTSLCVGCGIISNETVEGLLEGCPLLEDLKLVGCIGLEYVEISPRRSPRLKNLLLLSFYHRKWIGARIDAPNLRSIQFGGSVSNLDWRGSAVLTEANLTTKSEEDFKSFEDWMKIVLAVSNVRVLKVNYWFYQYEIPKNYSSGLLFKNLKELHCDIDWVTGSVFRSLTHCLAECPLLEKLMINLNREVRAAVKDLVQKASNAGAEDTPELYYTSSPFLHTDALVKRVQDEHEQDAWNPAEHFGELDCCLHHLKIITVKEFVGSKNEMRLFEFLLGKAIALEQFIVFDLLNRVEWDLQEIFSTVAKASSQVDMRLSLWENLEDKFFKRIFA